MKSVLDWSIWESVSLLYAESTAANLRHSEFAIFPPLEMKCLRSFHCRHTLTRVLLFHCLLSLSSQRRYICDESLKSVYSYAKGESEQKTSAAATIDILACCQRTAIFLALSPHHHRSSLCIRYGRRSHGFHLYTLHTFGSSTHSSST